MGRVATTVVAFVGVDVSDGVALAEIPGVCCIISDGVLVLKDVNSSVVGGVRGIVGIVRVVIDVVSCRDISGNVVDVDSVVGIFKLVVDSVDVVDVDDGVDVDGEDVDDVVDIDDGADETCDVAEHARVSHTHAATGGMQSCQ